MPVRVQSLKLRALVLRPSLDRGLWPLLAGCGRIIEYFSMATTFSCSHASLTYSSLGAIVIVEHDGLCSSVSATGRIERSGSTCPAASR